MPLDTGAWNILANGFQGTLQINGVDAAGNLDPSSSVYGQPIFGFWDEEAQRITFVRPPFPSIDSTAYQIYTGYQMTGPGGFVLAGSFEAFSGTGGTARRSVFGWFASIV